MNLKEKKKNPYMEMKSITGFIFYPTQKTEPRKTDAVYRTPVEHI